MNNRAESGWEFPPVIDGGLGVTCIGLSKGLSNYQYLRICKNGASSVNEFDREKAFQLTVF